MNESKTILDGVGASLEQATREVFETMVFMTAEKVGETGRAMVLDEEEVIASLGFTGTHPGVLVTGSGLAASRSVTANMLGMEPGEIGDDSEVCDAMGEIANMIAGNVKNAFVDQGLEMEIAVPSVSVGKRANDQQEPGTELFGHRLDFTLEGEHPFTVEIRFQKDRG
jgi:chemotaxis protein CheX